MSATKIPPLGKDNYDTWAIHAQSLLTKNKQWKYVKTPPTDKPEDIEEDEIAKAELLLMISASELKQVKNCKTTKEVWDTLKKTYASKGPARKASLLKELILLRLGNNDIREHLNKFMDIVDKLKDLDIEINNELLTVMMLYSLNDEFETFRIAIESQDNLPDADKLKIKIIEESDARRRNTQQGTSSTYDDDKDEEALYAFCKICKKKGHNTAKCWSKSKNTNKNKSKRNFQPKNNFSCFLGNDTIKNAWILDSGCNTHMTNSTKPFKKLNKISKTLRLASNDQTTKIEGIGPAEIEIEEGTIGLSKAIYVPTLCANLLSVGQMTDAGQTVLFTKTKAIIKDQIRGVQAQAVRGPDGLYYFKTIKNDVDRREIKANVVNDKNYTQITNGKTVNNQKSNKRCDSRENQDEIIEWHKKLGHMNERDMKFAMKNDSLIGLSFDTNCSLGDCEICIQSKLCKKPANSEEKKTCRTTKRLEIIHSDVCGPISTSSLEGKKYMVTFIDDYSRYCKVYFMKRKNEVLDKFKEFKLEVENFTESKIKCLQTDNGTEYCNEKFSSFLKENGITRRLTVPYTPNQNGVAERKNRTLIEKARCMMLESKAPLFLWPEAVFTANYLCNRSINQTLGGTTPFEKWVGRKPCVKHLYVFGSKTFVLKKDRSGHKFSSKAMIGMFAGYSEIRKAFRVYVPNLKRIISAKDVRVIKKMLYCDSVQENTPLEIELNETNEKSANSNGNNDHYTENNIVHFPSNESEQEPDTSNQNNDSYYESPSEGSPSEGLDRDDYDEIGNAESEQNNEFDNDQVENTENEMYNVNERETDGDETVNEHESNEIEMNTVHEEAQSREIPTRMNLRDRSQIRPPKKFDDYVLTAIQSEKPTEPQSFREAMTSANKTKWLEAMHNEFTSLNENQTWELTDLPKGRKPLPCKWVYKLKTNPDGSIERYKARLVVKGFSQKQGIDYDKTFSPVVRLSTVRAILGLAAHENYVLQQFDVSTAFLNGTVQEEIFMAQPDGYQDGTNRVCKLKRSLYGLKQAPLCWNTCISNYLLETGFERSIHDPCLYIKKHVLIALYVDDGLVASTNEKAGKYFIEQLKSRFKITTKPASYFLGMEIQKHSDGTITMDQKAYTKKILEKYGMENCKAVPTPAIKINKDEQEDNNEPDDSNFPYRQAVGALAYLMVATRPDICFAVSVVSRHLENPTKLDVKNVKRIFRYLKGTITMGLIFKRSGEDMLHGYSDADYGGDNTTGHSTTGMVFIYHGPIMWKSQKQNNVAISSTEAELMALTETAKEVIWLKGLLNDIGRLRGTPVVYVDNESAIKLAENPPYEYHRRTKHIKLKHFFVRECVTNKELLIKQVPTELQLADIFTKPLHGPRLQQLSKKIGLEKIFRS